MIQFSWVAESGLDGTAGEVIALAANQERDRVAGRRRQPNQVESNSIEPSAFGLFARPRKKADIIDSILGRAITSEKGHQRTLMRFSRGRVL